MLLQVADTGKLCFGSVLDFPALPPAARQEEEMSREEVTAAWNQPEPEQVSVRNVYFEPVSISSLQAVVTEDGPLATDEVQERVGARLLQACMAFDLPPPDSS